MPDTFRITSRSDPNDVPRAREGLYYVVPQKDGRLGFFAIAPHPESYAVADNFLHVKVGDGWETVDLYVVGPSEIGPLEER